MRPFFHRPPLPTAWRMRPTTPMAFAQLRQANVWIAQGEFVRAARTFIEAGEQARAHGLPSAPQLLLQPGRAYLVAGETEAAVECLRQGFTLVAGLGQFGRIPRLAHHVLEDLRAHGLVHQAAKPESGLAAIGRAIDLKSSTPSPVSSRRGRLPAKCSCCGRTVHPDALEWIHHGNATCACSGSVVQEKG